MKLTFGIDPGLTGGIAYIVNSGDAWAAPLWWKGKELDARRLYDWIITTIGVYYTGHLPSAVDVLIVIEKVHAMPKQGSVSMFNFGSGFGELKAVAKMTGHPWVLVPPQTWKKHVLAGTDKSKGATVEWALRTYASNQQDLVKKSGLPHLGAVDALAIAHYGHHYHAR